MKILTALQTAFYLSISIGLWVLIFMHPKEMLAAFVLLMAAFWIYERVKELLSRANNKDNGEEKH